MTPKEEKEKLFKDLANINIHLYDSDKKLYKYVPIDTARLILTDGSLCFSSPEKLADYDLEMDLLEINLTLKQLRKKKEHDYSVYLKTIEHRSDSYIRSHLKSKDGKRYLDTVDYKKVLHSSYNSLRTKYGLFCATTSNNNSRMWQDYANNDTGVCIEYMLPLFNRYYHTLKVYYDKEFKPFNLFDSNGAVNEVAVQRWYFTKRIRYDYEDEVRIFCDAGPRIEPFPKDVFTGLYYGKETSDNDIADLELLLKNGGYSFNKGIKAIY